MRNLIVKLQGENTDLKAENTRLKAELNHSGFSGTEREELLKNDLMSAYEVTATMRETITRLEAELAEAQSKLMKWGSGICSRHRDPDADCDICNPKAALEQAYKELAEVRNVVDAAVAYCDQLCSFNVLTHPEVHIRRLRLSNAVNDYHHRGDEDDAGEVRGE